MRKKSEERISNATGTGCAIAAIEASKHAQNMLAAAEAVVSCARFVWDPRAALRGTITKHRNKKATRSRWMTTEKPKRTRIKKLVMMEIEEEVARRINFIGPVRSCSIRDQQAISLAVVGESAPRARRMGSTLVRELGTDASAVNLRLGGSSREGHVAEGRKQIRAETEVKALARTEAPKRSGDKSRRRVGSAGREISSQGNDRSSWT